MPDTAHNGLVVFINSLIFDLYVNRRLKIIKRMGKILLGLVAHQLPGKLTFFRDAKDNSSAASVKKRAQCSASLNALPCSCLIFEDITFVISNHFLDVINRHSFLRVKLYHTVVAPTHTLNFFLVLSECCFTVTD